MEKKEYLNEEKYQKTKNKISVIGKVVLTILWTVGLGLISIGIFNIIKYNDKDALKQEEAKLVKIQEELEQKVNPIEDEIKKLDRDKYDTNNSEERYAIEDRIEELTKSIERERKQLELIEGAIDEFDTQCGFSDYREYELVSTYCDYRELNEMKIIPFIIPGIFISFLSFGLTMMFIMTTKRREIMAYGMQDMRPLAEEGAEKMAPTAGKVAEEVAKGIKKGLDKE